MPERLGFLDAGRTILAIGSATDLGIQLQLPITSALVDSAGRSLPRSRFYVPGSILSMRVDTTLALAEGMSPVTEVYDANATGVSLLTAEGERGVKKVVWIDGPAPLRSGGAWGQGYLTGVQAVQQAQIGTVMRVVCGAVTHSRDRQRGTDRV